MEKGVYTSIIGIMAIATVILIVFSTLTSLEKKSNENYANTITDVKRMWDNARQVLDKKTTTGLWNGGSCTGNPTTQYASALAELTSKSEINCEANNVQNLGNGDARLELKCSKEIKKNGEIVFYVEYAGTVEFKKIVNTATGCTITDEQSGITEAP